ncbi:MAG: hypothetical protein WCS77_07940 [Elusimicrobiaceae bacterium]|jgi:hypothetical protein
MPNADIAKTVYSLCEFLKKHGAQAALETAVERLAKELPARRAAYISLDNKLASCFHNTSEPAPAGLRTLIGIAENEGPFIIKPGSDAAKIIGSENGLVFPLALGGRMSGLAYFTDLPDAPDSSDVFLLAPFFCALHFKTLLETAETKALLSEHAREALFAVENGKIVCANDRAAKLLGKTNLENADFAGLLAETDIEKISALHAQCALDGDPELSYETGIRLTGKTCLIKAKTIHIGNRTLGITSASEKPE